MCGIAPGTLSSWRESDSGSDWELGREALGAVAALTSNANAEVSSVPVKVPAPAALFERIAMPAIEEARVFVPCSVGALLPRMHLVRRAQTTGARIVVPTGALLGLDVDNELVRRVRRRRPSRSP